MSYIRRAIFNIQMELRKNGDDKELYEILDKLIEIEERLKTTVINLNFKSIRFERIKKLKF